MSFVPLQYTIQTPRSGAEPVAAAAATDSKDRRVSILVPITRQIDLWEMSGANAPNPSATYVRDFFLAHWSEATIQRVYISFSRAMRQLALQPFYLQLIVKNGAEESELTDRRQYATLTVETDIVEDVFPNFTGALFLRVSSASQVASLFVTLEVLSSKVF